MKELEIKIKGNSFMCTEIKYNLGGYNFGTGIQEKRGYYLGITPKEITGNTVMFGAFTGYRNHIHEVKRKSEKSYVEAVRIAVEEQATMITTMINLICYSEKIPDEKCQEITEATLVALGKHYEDIK